MEKELNIENLNLKEFILLVKDMRFNQRRFRKSQKPEIKETLDPLETKVDELIATFCERQTKFF